MKIQQTPLGAWAELLEDMVDAMPAAVLLLTPNGRIIEANPKAQLLLGNDLRGHHLDHVLQSHTIDPETQDIIPLAKDSKASKIVINQNHMENGCTVVVIQDITEHDLATFNQAQASKMEAIGQVAARLAHQMKTPLSAALLKAEKIARRSHDTGMQADAMNLQSLITTLNKRVNALLQFVRGTPPQETRFAVAPVIQQTINTLQPIAHAAQASIGLATSTPAELVGNPDDFSGAITSLLENALEANAKNLILSIIEQDGMITIELTDDGHGCSPAHVTQALDPFFTTKQHGTGLGLSIANDVFTQLGGSVRIVPAARGTTVVCTAKAA